MMRKILLGLWLAWGILPVAQAKVFNINRESFASYFSVGGGSSLMGTSAFSGESGSGVSFSQKSQYLYQGEFGFLYSVSLINLRFGIEILKPQVLEGNASNTSGDLYRYKNDILGFAPKLGLEINLDRQAASRSFVSIGAGIADVSLKTDYVLTSLGQSTYSGVTDHGIEAKGTGTTLSAALGYESLLSDSTTLAFEMGYRQLKVDKFKYSKSATTFTGAKASGDTVVDSDGNNRKIDLGGFFIALGFRFYL
jgi:hypothetical protein